MNEGIGVGVGVGLIYLIDPSEECFQILGIGVHKLEITTYFKSVFNIGILSYCPI
jgi:hypothetical protein